MIVKLLTEHHLEFLGLKGGCRGSFESKMPHCWKSHALAQNFNYFFFFTKLFICIFIILAPQKRKLPIEGPWRHFSIKDFIKNVQEGKVETGWAHSLVYADMGLVVRKPVFGASDKARQKPVSSATETS